MRYYDYETTKEDKMKTANILLLLVVMGTLTLGFADVNSVAPRGIDAQITAIKTAKPEDRVTLMNQFKTQLSNMNAEDRSAALSHMQAKMQGHMQEHGGDANHPEGGMRHEGMDEMGKNRMQEHAGEMQSNMNEGMNRMQNMNQQQAGNHYGQEMQGAGAKMENRSTMSGQNMQNIGQDYMKRDH